MSTKECRHCKQPIHPEARVCHHCKSNQTWTANQGDPRNVVVVLALVAALLFFLIFGTHMLSKTRGPGPELVVKENSVRYVDAPAGTMMFVMGTAENMSDVDAAEVWFRVNLIGASGDSIDTILDEQLGLVVPSKSTAPFKIYGPISVRKDEVKAVRVVVERVRRRNRYD